MDPRSGSSDVGPIEHLKHVPPQIKYVVKLLEMHLRQTPHTHYDINSGRQCGKLTANPVLFKS